MQMERMGVHTQVGNPYTYTVTFHRFDGRGWRLAVVTPAVNNHPRSELPLDGLGDQVKYFNTIVPLPGEGCVVVCVLTTSSCLRRNSMEMPPVSNAASPERSTLRRVIMINLLNDDEYVQLYCKSLFALRVNF